MNKNKLSTKTCKPCAGIEKPLEEDAIAKYLNSLERWVFTHEETVLFRDYKMNNFMEAIDLINKIAVIAEEQAHHPDIHLTDYKYLRIELKTHTIEGLSENDFIMAAKINELG